MVLDRRALPLCMVKMSACNGARRPPEGQQRGREPPAAKPPGLLPWPTGASAPACYQPSPAVLRGPRLGPQSFSTCTCSWLTSRTPPLPQNRRAVCHSRSTSSPPPRRAFRVQQPSQSSSSQVSTTWGGGGGRKRAGGAELREQAGRDAGGD